MRVSLLTLALLPAAAFGFLAPAMPAGVVSRQGSLTAPAAASPLFLRSDRTSTFSGAPAGVTMDMFKGIGFPELKATGMRIGIVHSRWNAEVVGKLKAGAKQALLDNGIKEEDVIEFESLVMTGTS
ncbi:hypothetical protein T484DRAFT_1868209 [Baffinella frigidus]|nr:hypothetical protein T484DRAFT_1868209 [Cryptophyta sp. CCMP2293]